MVIHNIPKYYLDLYCVTLLLIKSSTEMLVKSNIIHIGLIPQNLYFSMQQNMVR